MTEPQPRCVVSLVPSLTEALFDLGAGERVVGVTDWCTPALPEGEERPRIGGVRDPRVDEILALGAELVVASREENRREDVEALRTAGVQVWVTDPRTPTDAADMTRALGRLVGCEARAEGWAREIEEAVAGAAARAVRTPIPVVYPIWREPWMTVGDRSYAAAVLEAAGAHIVGGIVGERYPKLDLDRAAASAAVLLLPDEPFDFHGPAGEALATELRARGARNLTAAQVDGRLAAWYGTRSGRRLDALARLLAP